MTPSSNSSFPYSKLVKIWGHIDASHLAAFASSSGFFTTVGSTTKWLTATWLKLQRVPSVWCHCSCSVPKPAFPNLRHMLLILTCNSTLYILHGKVLHFYSPFFATYKYSSTKQGALAGIKYHIWLRFWWTTVFLCNIKTNKKHCSAFVCCFFLTPTWQNNYISWKWIELKWR